MLWLCLSLIPVALLISVLLCALLLRFSTRLGLLDDVGSEPHKQSGQPLPNTGGIAIFVAVSAPLAAALSAVWLVGESSWARWLPALGDHVAGLRRMSGMGGGVLCAMTVLHLTGLYDDRRAIKAVAKFAVQVAVAIGLVIWCDMRVLVLLSGQHGAFGSGISVILSVAWIVLIVNAFNMLDNMDGLCAGVGIVCAGMYLASTLIGGQWFVAALAALVVAALLGFLPFNFSPARMYMGDGGSLVVGLLLAVISIRTTYFASDLPIATRPGHWYGVLMPLMVLAIPIYDFVSVTLIRLTQGRRPWRGDQQHFSHRLLRLGLSRRSAVIVIWICALASGLSGVMLAQLSKWQALVAAVQTLLIVAMLAVLEFNARRGERDER